MSTRRVLLLRHGRTSWNAQRRFQGQADPPLDEVGRTQAYEVAALVAALHPDLIVSSSAIRAMQTALPLGEVTGLTVRSEPRLQERSLGHWEGLTRDEVEVQYPEEFAEWLAGLDVRRRGGESRDEVAARAVAAFEELPHVPLAVLVTHSATAMALCSALLGLPQQPHVLGPLANCHWTELSHEGRWQLRAHNAGAPGPVIPRLSADEDAPDAQA